MAEDDEFPVVDSADDVATADAAEDVVVAAADSVAAVATADAAEDVVVAAVASGGDVVVAAADFPAASDDAVEEDEVDVVVEDEVDDVVVEDEVVDVVVEDEVDDVVVDVVVSSAAAVVIGSCVEKKSSPSSQIIGVGVVVVLWPRSIALKPFRITSITHASLIGNSLQTERASNIS